MISKKANTHPPFAFALILSLNILTISSPPQIRALTPSAEGLPPPPPPLSLDHTLTHTHTSIQERPGKHLSKVRVEAAEDHILECVNPITMCACRTWSLWCTQTHKSESMQVSQSSEHLFQVKTRNKLFYLVSFRGVSQKFGHTFPFTWMRNCVFWLVLYLMTNVTPPVGIHNWMLVYSINR